MRALVAIGIAVEKLFFSIARIQDSLGQSIGHSTGVAKTQLPETILVNNFPGPPADELARDRMEQVGRQVHEQQWLLLVVGHLVVARACACDGSIHACHFSVLPRPESSLVLAQRT